MKTHITTSYILYNYQVPQLERGLAVWLEIVKKPLNKLWVFFLLSLKPSGKKPNLVALFGY